MPSTATSSIGFSNSPAPSRGRRLRRVRLASLATILVSLVLLVRLLPVDRLVTLLSAKVESLGVWGPATFALVYVLAAVLFVPGSALTLAAGAVFGLVTGTLVVSVASTTAAAVSFLIGRHLARDTVHQWAARNPRFAAIDRAIGEGGWKIIALLRLSPAVPFSLGNYLYGVTSIRFWPYVLTSWLAMLPGTFMYVYLGYAGRAGLGAAAGAEGGRSPAQWALLVFGLAATVAVTAVGGLFVLSPTQFPWYYTWMLPFLVLAPARALVLYTALLPLYHLHYDYPWILWIEHLPVWLLIGWAAWRWRSVQKTEVEPGAPDDDYTPPTDVRIAVVIPALNEERAIGSVLAAIPKWVSQIVVADNGSTDRTAAIAQQHGAIVVREPQRGYGAACLAGLAALDRPDIIVFLDGDFSDHPQEMSRLIAPIVRDEADLVIGSRVLGHSEAGALTPQQRFGNALACRLIRLFYGVRHTDLGPFRAVRYVSLQRLKMNDRDYGWTVQMQVRAARFGMRTTEVPVSYRPRIGKSKISGTIRGVIGAGVKIISTIFREAIRARASQPASATERLVIFGRYPTPGEAKTRLIPLLGPTGAALLHRQLVRITVETARRLRCRRSVMTELRFTGGSRHDMAALFGCDLIYREQGTGDLGQRLRRAATEAICGGARKVVLVGTDCPLLDADRLDQAFTALDDHDVVIGPAVDGGYYLIGVKSDHAELFNDIAWGGEQVLAQTLDACRRLGLRHALLPPLSDVDTPDDLAVWARCPAGHDQDTPTHLGHHSGP